MHHRAAGALLLVLVALPAGAQAPEVDLSLFRPASGGDGTMGVEGARPLPEGAEPIELPTGGPVLLRIEKHSGHGGADLVKATIEKTADEYAFTLSQLATPESRPTASR